MKLKSINDLNATETIKRLNPGLFGLGGVESKKPEQKGQTLDGRLSAQQKGECGMAKDSPVVRVTLISFRRRELDDDNLVGGFKPMRDAIARWLGLDDSQRIIDWQYGQIETKGRTGTAVKIEQI